MVVEEKNVAGDELSVEELDGAMVEENPKTMVELGKTTMDVTLDIVDIEVATVGVLDKGGPIEVYMVIIAYAK